MVSFITIPSILGFGKSLLERVVRPGDTVLDGTVGNGKDTLFLAELVGESGKVLGFDIQEEAISRTHELLNRQGCAERVELYCLDHAHIATCLPEGESLSAGMFNLGYLPGADSEIITRPESTLAALTQCAKSLCPGGLLCITAYTAHPGGSEEAEAVLRWAAGLDTGFFGALSYRFPQRNDAPFLLVVERLHTAGPAPVSACPQG